jgi:hypothetical protein
VDPAPRIRHRGNRLRRDNIGRLVADAQRHLDVTDDANAIPDP